MWQFNEKEIRESCSQEYTIIFNSLPIVQEALRRLVEKEERALKFGNFSQCETYQLEMLMVNIFLKKIGKLIEPESLHEKYQESCKKVGKPCLTIAYLERTLPVIIDQNENRALDKVKGLFK